MEAEYGIELLNMPEEEGEPISSRIDYGGIDSDMVGLSNYFEDIRNHFLGEAQRNWLLVTGMAGVGKTTLAKKVFDDPSIQRHFELRAWVKVGRKCEFNEILRCILAQVDPDTHDHMVTHGEDGDDEKLVGVLEERLKVKKCLIVLEDIWGWDTQVMDNLPQENVRILLTSRQRFLEYQVQIVRLLDEEESKQLLGKKVFGEEGFPFHLEKLGEKIAKKCEGLPLMIVTVAELLSEEDKTPEFWTEVAEKQHNLVFEGAYDQISEVLFPSYDYLPQYLKMFFLYLGAFRPYRDIRIYGLLGCLSAEGFMEPTEIQNLQDFVFRCMVELGKRYQLVLLGLDRLSWFSNKDFRVHSCWQHLCINEARKIKFLHVLQSLEDDMEDMKDQRRLCAHSNTLFSFKEVHDSIKSDCAHNARSLLCYGPYHQYSVPMHAMDFKLLRVLEALQVRFYGIPLEILKLVCLKYLALTCNKDLPASISNLFHLQFLIIHRNMHIKKCGVLSYVPMEIWEMQELLFIDILGRELPTPNSNATLDKLSFLFGVSAKSCTREILKRMPNLMKLLILSEREPYDDDDDKNPLCGLEYISEELRNLKFLNYSVVNPEMKYVSRVPLSMFPTSLTVLHLSGLGCPWKHIIDIGLLLPNLETLRLEHYAFQGPEWDIVPGCFLKLQTLIIGDTDLVRWRIQHGSLPKLDLLTIRHCYKLQQLDWMRGPSMVTKPTIELFFAAFLFEMREVLLDSQLG
ncbi:putative late blight resistance protein homolog R1A-4 isoform X2 [Salvia splendens]|uniref:putative late blight resistance protein homolog R1A-4 isoform X2 n=1 Tax=Salvia splendens TaxID=180675 RepID=UPI001C27519D|nr:putative late blight resistance protein homolog R1A-4 isoform X2 [Salvia splendens]